MIFGWVVLATGAVVLIWPSALVRIAPYYRGSVPTEPRAAVIRSARIGAALIVAAGVVILFVS